MNMAGCPAEAGGYLRTKEQHVFSGEFLEGICCFDVMDPGSVGLTAEKCDLQQVLMPGAETIRKSYHDMVKYA